MSLVHRIYHHSCRAADDYYYLRDLSVAKGLRSEGIECWLIEHVYAEAGVADCSRVYWLTRKNNSDAMKLYECIADKLGPFQYRRVL